MKSSGPAFLKSHGSQEVQGPRDVIQNRDAGGTVRYDAQDRAGNLARLAEAHRSALGLDRRKVRAYAENWDWKYSVLEFLHRLSRLAKQK
jgi:hypothetical protein